MYTTSAVYTACNDDCLRERTPHPEQCVFFDIETTGFKASMSHLYLIGLGEYTPDGRKITQLLSEKATEEAALLRTFAQLLRPYTTVISFNGDRFDIPYLREKYAQYGLEDPFDRLESIDIYQDIRPFRSVLSLDHMNQKALEAFLGLHREDKYDGGRLIPVFRKFVASGDEHLRQLLLLHNYEDVCGMLMLTKLYAYPAALRALPTDVQVSAGDDEETFTLTFALPLPVPTALTTRQEAFTLSLRGSTAHIKIRAARGQLLYFFDNYKDYYYLPEEDQAIHKDVAVYVDKAHRRKATAKTCYIRQAGLFWPQPGAHFTPALRRSFEDTLRFFAPPLTLTGEALSSFYAEYAALLLSSIATPAR